LGKWDLKVTSDDSTIRIVGLKDYFLKLLFQGTPFRRTYSPFKGLGIALEGGD